MRKPRIIFFDIDGTLIDMEKYTMPTPELLPMSLLRRKTAE